MWPTSSSAGSHFGTKILALTVVDRESILRALEECPDGFGELRAVLLREHEWRVREGLISGLPPSA